MTNRLVRAVTARMEVASGKWDLSGLEKDMKGLSKKEQARHLSELRRKMEERLSVLNGNLQSHGSDRARDSILEEYGDLHSKIKLLKIYEYQLEEENKIFFRKY